MLNWMFRAWERAAHLRHHAEGVLKEFWHAAVADMEENQDDENGSNRLEGADQPRERLGSPVRRSPIMGGPLPDDGRCAQEPSVPVRNRGDRAGGTERYIEDAVRFSGVTVGEPRHVGLDQRPVVVGELTDVQAYCAGQAGCRGVEDRAGEGTALRRPAAPDRGVRGWRSDCR